MVLKKNYFEHNIKRLETPGYRLALDGDPMNKSTTSFAQPEVCLGLDSTPSSLWPCICIPKFINRLVLANKTAIVHNILKIPSM